MKTHVSVSIFLLLVLYNLMGFIAAFQAVRYEWRQSVRAELAKVAEDNLVHFVFAKNDVPVSKKEFKHKGKYYDIVRTETKGDSIDLYCFDDATETRLVGEYHQLILKNTAQDDDYQHKTQYGFQLLIKDFYFPLEKTEKSPPSVYRQFKSLFYFKNPFFPPNYIPTDTPPPNVHATFVA
jgi:hypothetical protein